MHLDLFSSAKLAKIRGYNYYTRVFDHMRASGAIPSAGHNDRDSACTTGDKCSFQSPDVLKGLNRGEKRGFEALCRD